MKLVGGMTAAFMMLTASAVSANAQSREQLQTVEETRVVPQGQAEITLSFAPVVKKAAPAVVNIYTRKVVQRRASPFAGDPFFERFFKDMFPTDRRKRKIENSLGSGVILDASGVVVSNHHVIEGADEITVVLQDRREFEGRVILADKESDLAIIKLEDANNLPTLEIRDSDTMEVGDLVLAIGNPFGVGQTVTSGIISGLGRSGGSRGRGAGVFIQTDAAINPGNSGGALVDMKGRLVGINTAILSRSGGSNGIGFAVPAKLVARVVETAISGESRLARPWLGIDAVAVDGDLASALGLQTPRGLLIKAIHPESPMADTGIGRGDVLTLIDDDPVNTLQELEFHATSKLEGTEAEVTYLSDGIVGAGTFLLSAAPEVPDRDRRELGRGDDLPGLTMINVNPAVIDELNLSVLAEGVLVLRAQGPARRVGLRRGDFLRKIDGHEVADVEEAVALLAKTSGETVLQVERDGRLGKVQYRR